MVEDLIGRVSGGEDLSVDETTSLMDAIMQGQVPAEQIGVLLIALKTKGETHAEVAGAAQAMRNHMTPIKTKHTQFIDTCGTGGDGSGTFNISTAAAIVTAAAGLPVAKHGNRSISSKSGSADVLASLGVNIEASVATVEKCIDEVNIGFCFAPSLHPAMRHVGPVRKQLGVPTIFNMLGPLCNPASAPYQLLGVGKPHLRPLLSAALAELGIQRAVVVCGEDGVDEVTLSGVTHVTLVEGGELEERQWHPSDFGIETASNETMIVDGPEESAALIQKILQGAKGPSRDIVVLNCAAALWTADPTQSLTSCAERAATAIDSGAASQLLAKLAEVSHQ